MIKEDIEETRLLLLHIFVLRLISPLSLYSERLPDPPSPRTPFPTPPLILVPACSVLLVLCNTLLRTEGSVSF